MDKDLFEKLAEKYPFITLCVSGSDEYLGIVQNRDDSITTIYDYGSIRDIALRKQFLELANIWWWESNRSIPINLFLKQDWEPFREYLKTFSNKDLKIVHGPSCSLSDIAKKKGKKKSITLVRKMP